MIRSERISALMRGFWNGLAGPVSLFAEPRRIEPVKIEIKKLHRSITDPVEAMRSDWEQVGSDLRAVLDAIPHGVGDPERRRDRP